MDIKNLIPLVLLVFVAFIAPGQKTTMIPSEKYLNDIIFMSNLSNRSIEYSNIQGSPYFGKTNNPINGDLILNNGDHITDIPMKYDLYKKDIIATNKLGKEILLDTRFYKKMVLGVEGKDIVFAKINPATPDLFYEVLYTDNAGLVLYRDTRVKFHKAKNLGVGKLDPQFQQVVDYYLIQDYTQIEKVKLKKKDFLKRFSKEEANEMTKLINEQGYKMKKVDDYIAVLKALRR